MTAESINNISNPIYAGTEEDSKLGKTSSANNTADKIVNTPRLIYLFGTSTSGKTSIMRAFAERFKAVAHGTDDFADTRNMTLVKKHLQSNFPKEWNILSEAVDDEHLMEFVFSTPKMLNANPTLFKSGSSEIQRNAAKLLKEEFKFFLDDQSESNVFFLIFKNKNSDSSNKGDLQDRAHFNTIIAAYDQNRTVIFDTPNAQGFDNHLKEKSREIPIHRVLVYVPIKELMNRLPKRNAVAIQTGHLSDRRECREVLEQFTQVYRKAGPNDLIVDTLKLEDVENIFAKHAKDLGEENDGLGEHAMTKEKFMSHFGFSPGCKEVDITTNVRSQQFDGIFRTAVQTAEQSAEQLALPAHKWEQLKKAK